MSKYIPKVGEAFEWFNCTQEEWVKTNAVVLVTENEIASLDDDGMIELYSFSDKFRPIPTKADVEREQLTRLISDSYSRCTGPDYCAKKIIKAGFTIPKKVKRSEIADVVVNTSPMISVEDLVDEICNLLGDLVEDD